MELPHPSEPSKFSGPRNLGSHGEAAKLCLSQGWFQPFWIDFQSQAYQKVGRLQIQSLLGLNLKIDSKENS
jgi:hypothetical protein